MSNNVSAMFCLVHSCAHPFLGFMEPKHLKYESGVSSKSNISVVKLLKSIESESCSEKIWINLHLSLCLESLCLPDLINLIVDSTVKVDWIPLVGH